MTYAGLALLFVAAAALTAAFDSLMIAADLFRYDAGSLTGLRVLLAPVEDFAWPVVAVLLLPALWELLGSAERRGASRRER